ncbi:alpha/beta hydrolase [Dokdonella soli]|uniref:AB hydrolase-1 domain-containing protein n=1 Tax=Dokdonella soli TaxID=529810 RepID=A0ABP3U9R3_9GAMM
MLNDICWVLLPGLDGSGELFCWFRTEIPGEHVVVVRYPKSADWQIDDYAAHVRSLLPRDRRCVLIAESFSGPIALRLSRQIASVVAIVLVASFVACPHPLLRMIPMKWARAMRGIGSSRVLLRLACLGWRSPRDRVDILLDIVRGLPVDVLRARLGILRGLDVRGDLRAMRVPALWLAAAQDRLVIECGDAFRDCTTVERRTIDGPHFLLQAAPAECWRAIDAWWRDLNGSKATAPCNPGDDVIQL